jgi:hypothetical protein
VRFKRESAGTEAGLSKLNSVRPAYIEVNVFLGDSSDRTTEVIKRVESPRRLRRAPDSLERR